MFLGCSRWKQQRQTSAKVYSPTTSSLSPLDPPSRGSSRCKLTGASLLATSSE